MYNHRDVKKEYNAAADKHDEEHKKVMWESKATMENRFHLAMGELDFKKSENWLDVGCGTGELQRLVYIKNPDIKAVGIDISIKLIGYAKSKVRKSNIKFSLCDYMNYNGGPFDIITCIGVLQKTSFTPEQFFHKSFELLSDNGVVFLDTKNINWEGFADTGIKPDKSYKSFEVDKLREAAENACLRVLKIEGFLPKKNKIVMTNQSQTVFMVCTKTP
ncbi:MAG: class I SAM-dependent methyltransferase [Planctomycetota bacterium]|jgi:cyclopropane fatty-acyl-phospholipid synthase-like methyltransferase